MAQRKQPAGGKRRSARRAKETLAEAAYGADKPMRAAGAAAQSLGRQGADAVEVNAREVGGRMQEAAQVLTELAQDAMRQNVESAQNLMRCRTVTDLVEVQADWLRRSLDNVMNRGARLSELSAAITMETMGRFGGVAGASFEEVRRTGQRLQR